MGTASGMGIGIGIGVVIGIAVIMSFVAINQGTITLEDIPVLENIPTLEFDDPRFASLEASYDELDDKTTVILFFTNNDGNYVKANGEVKITICHVPYGEDRLTNCFSNEFEFEKGDFYTRQDNSGRKLIGHQFVIYKELSAGLSWDASTDIITENGISWVDVDTTFISLE